MTSDSSNSANFQVRWHLNRKKLYLKYFYLFHIFVWNCKSIRNFEYVLWDEYSCWSFHIVPVEKFNVWLHAIKNINSDLGYLLHSFPLRNRLHLICGCLKNCNWLFCNWTTSALEMDEYTIYKSSVLQLFRVWRLHNSSKRSSWGQSPTLYMLFSDCKLNLRLAEFCKREDNRLNPENIGRRKGEVRKTNSRHIYFT